TVEPVDAGGPSGASPPDPVSRPESTPRPLSLSPPPTSMGFNDDPMSKGRATAMAQPDRMNLQLVDRSFGGTMQRVTKARTCGDLRAALRQHSGSTMTILRTMTRLGCEAAGSRTRNDAGIARQGLEPGRPGGACRRVPQFDQRWPHRSRHGRSVR